MNETQIEIAEKYRGWFHKFALKQIYHVYDAHNNSRIAIDDCFCSVSHREDMSKKFYQWYDSIQKQK